MQPKNYFPDTPSQSLLDEQLEANERLLVAALHAQEDAEDAHSGRVVAEDESDALRTETVELLAAGEFRERLLGVVGHDLRSPLKTIVNAAEQLAAGKDLPVRNAWLASRILDSGRRMERMIDQLASFTQARTGGGFELNLAACDLSRVCRDVVEDLRLAWSVPIHLHAEGDLTGVWDEDRITQVLMNLVGNALEHAATGTPVTVRARGDSASVSVEVENEGPSIPPDLVAHIFSAFKSGRRGSERGPRHLGLGLFISREIALSHDGSLDLQSGDDKTSLVLRLPRGPVIR
jgi:signal transduction histidine kinase